MDKEAILSAYNSFKEKFAGFLNFEDIPYIRYEVDKNYNPKTEGREIKCLLIAESPPPVGYFYDNDFSRRRPLRAEIFKLLNIEYSKSGLFDFKKRGCFLIDAIKLRIRKKTNGKKLHHSDLLELADCSAGLLRKEIDKLRPKEIWIMGRVAKRSFLQAFSDFKGESDYNRLREAMVDWENDENVPRFNIGSNKVLLTRLPFWRLETWKKQTKLMKREIILC